MCPHLWFGMQSVQFRHTGSGKCEVPSILHFSTAHASLCGRFSSFRPTRFHYNGNPPDRCHPRVAGLEDKHERVCLHSFSSSNLPGTHYPIYPRGDLHKEGSNACQTWPTVTVSSLHRKKTLGRTYDINLRVCAIFTVSELPFSQQPTNFSSDVYRCFQPWLESESQWPETLESGDSQSVNQLLPVVSRTSGSAQFLLPLAIVRPCGASNDQQHCHSCQYQSLGWAKPRSHRLDMVLCPQSQCNPHSLAPSLCGKQKGQFIVSYESPKVVLKHQHISTAQRGMRSPCYRPLCHMGQSSATMLQQSLL